LKNGYKKLADARRARNSAQISALANRRQQDVIDLFDQSNEINSIKVGNQLVSINQTQSRGAKVFNNVSEKNVKRFFVNLTGQKTLPTGVHLEIRGQVGRRYTVSTPQGNFTLRSVSSSTGNQGWTIEVPKSLSGGSTPEIKFL